VHFYFYFLASREHKDQKLHTGTEEGMSAYLLRLLGMGRALVDACDAALLAITGGGTRRFTRGLGLVFALSSATVAAFLAAFLRRRYLLTVQWPPPLLHHASIVDCLSPTPFCILFYYSDIVFSVY
jgi:hypothetical protein